MGLVIHRPKLHMQNFLVIKDLKRSENMYILLDASLPWPDNMIIITLCMESIVIKQKTNIVPQMLIFQKHIILQWSVIKTHYLDFTR